MSTHVPSLLNPSSADSDHAVRFAGEEKISGKSLADLLYDGFLMLFLLKNNHPPKSTEEFSERVKLYLADFERKAKMQSVAAQDIYAAKYAFCAAVDEIILQSDFSIRDKWFLQPLQLTLFGDQLAGNHFFDRLEDLRAEGAPRLQSLEVFHMCLLLGFQGKYFFDGKEKLSYLTARLGDEIAMMGGKRTGFSPHWAIPDSIAHKLKTEIPVWAIASIFLVLGILAYFGIVYFLGGDSNSMLAHYNEIVNMGPRAAHLTISLP